MLLAAFHAWVGQQEVGALSSIEHLLLPNEEIRFKSNSPVKHGNSPYGAWVTNQRLVLYAKRGLLGRHDLVAFHLRDVTGTQYREQGLISKRGILVVSLANTKTEIRGPAIDVKQLYMAAQNTEL